MEAPLPRVSSFCASSDLPGSQQCSHKCQQLKLSCMSCFKEFGTGPLLMALHGDNIMCLCLLQDPDCMKPEAQALYNPGGSLL